MIYPLGKVKGNKINIQKSVAFFNINNGLIEKESEKFPTHNSFKTIRKHPLKNKHKQESVSSQG